MKVSTLLLTLILALGVTAASAGEELTAAKKEDTRRLLEVTGALKAGQAMSEAVVKQMVETLKQARPDVPATAFNIVAEEVNGAIQEEMTVKGGFIDLMVGVYHKYFTHAEIRELLAFYRSPIGRKAGSLAPAMSREGFTVGQRWGQALGPKIEERVKARLKKEGIEL